MPVFSSLSPEFPPKFDGKFVTDIVKGLVVYEPKRHNLIAAANDLGTPTEAKWTDETPIYLVDGAGIISVRDGQITLTGDSTSCDVKDQTHSQTRTLILSINPRLIVNII